MQQPMVRVSSAVVPCDYSSWFYKYYVVSLERKLYDRQRERESREQKNR